MTRFALLIASVASAAAIAGCADHSTAQEQAGTVHLTLSEYRISPQNVSAHPGPITFVVRNAGRLAHDLRVEKGTHVLGGTTTLAPGASQSATFHHLQPGHYRILSSLHRDDTLGQYGKLTIHGR